MAIRSIAQLKKWFAKAKYPTESQFADLIDSFLHKEEDKVTINEIENLPEILNNKYTIADGQELEKQVAGLEKAIPKLEENIAQGDAQTLDSAKDYTDDREVVIMEVVDKKADLDNNGILLESQLPATALRGLKYIGAWNATTNTPALTNGNPAQTETYYIVSVAGTNLGNIYDVGDWVVNSGGTWGKLDRTDGVISVNGKQGVVVIGIADISGLQAVLDSLVGRPVITITNFDTVYSVHSVALNALAVGGSCNFIAGASTTGFPTLLGGYVLTGGITRTNTTTFVLEATSNNNVIATPTTYPHTVYVRSAVRTYTTTTIFPWYYGSEYTERSSATNGFTKYPDGRMEAWGITANIADTVNQNFGVVFTVAPAVFTSCTTLTLASTLGLVTSAIVSEITTAKCRITVVASNATSTSIAAYGPTYWRAIGRHY